MQYNIKMVKVTSGETVMGNYDEVSKSIKDVVLIQAVPSAQGFQIAMIPYGFPYDEAIGGEINEKHFMYEYKNVPGELQTKYIEAKSNIKIASNLGGIGGDGGSGLIL